ncbi:DNA mismatch repair endonuclease MutH [Fluctibacter corallii]|uniref:DNA mismatch repair endonuclease MutH n=1 Tax=Fluctibacter corallii TaxID=2984329 RepID=UPI00384CA922
MQPAKHPPTSINELVKRAEVLAGLSLGELANLADIHIPKDFKRDKGWTGQLLEHYLGAEAGSNPEQDFPELGVELKTIPIDANGMPLETTYVCYCPLQNIAGIKWATSNVRNKLACVLWIPIEGSRDIPVSARRVASPFLWSPSHEQLHALQSDWEELMEMISLGEIENVTARHGEVLQIRPKAADGSVLTDAIGSKGTLIKTRPRGFYLRKQFTGALLAQHFGL